MPTASKLVAGVLLGALSGWIAYFSVVPRLPEGVAEGRLVEITALYGVVFGWFLIGARVGHGWSGAVSHGLTGGIMVFSISLLTLSGWQTLMAAMRRRYDGLGDAFLGWLEKTGDNFGFAGAYQILVPLFLGAILIGLITEATSRIAR